MRDAWEMAEQIARDFGANYRVATPMSKSDHRPRERFTAYDVDRHIKAVANMIAEDIRSAASTARSQDGSRRDGDAGGRP